MPDLSYRIRVINATKAAFKEISADFQKLGGIARTIGSGISGAWNLVTGAPRRVAIAGGAAIGFLALAVREYAKAESAEIRLASAIRARGENVDEVLPKYKKYAMEIQRTTPIAHEETEAVMAQLAALGVNSSQMPTAIRLAVGLGGVMGDLTTAVRFTQMALGGNAKMLSRFSSEVRNAKTQEEAMAAVMKLADTGLQIQQAKINTVAGAATQAKTAFGEWMEELGGGIAKGLGLVDLFQQMRDAAMRWSEQLTASGRVEAWATRVRSLIDGIKTSMDKIAVGGATGAEGWKDIGDILRAAWSDALEAIRGPLADIAMAAGKEFGKGIRVAFPGIDRFAKGASQVGEVATTIAKTGIAGQPSVQVARLGKAAWDWLIKPWKQESESAANLAQQRSASLIPALREEAGLPKESTSALARVLADISKRPSAADLAHARQAGTPPAPLAIPGATATPPATGAAIASAKSLSLGDIYTARYGQEVGTELGATPANPIQANIVNIQDFWGEDNG